MAWALPCRPHWAPVLGKCCPLVAAVGLSYPRMAGPRPSQMVLENSWGPPRASPPAPVSLPCHGLGLGGLLSPSGRFTSKRCCSAPTARGHGPEDAQPLPLLQSHRPRPSTERLTCSRAPGPSLSVSRGLGREAVPGQARVTGYCPLPPRWPGCGLCPVQPKPMCGTLQLGAPLS